MSGILRLRTSRRADEPASSTTSTSTSTATVTGTTMSTPAVTAPPRPLINVSRPSLQARILIPPQHRAAQSVTPPTTTTTVAMPRYVINTGVKHTPTTPTNNVIMPKSALRKTPHTATPTYSRAAPALAASMTASNGAATSALASWQLKQRKTLKTKADLSRCVYCHEKVAIRVAEGEKSLLLPCLHLVCSSACLTSVFLGGQETSACPICKTVFRKDETESHGLVLTQIELPKYAGGLPKCEACTLENYSVEFCALCDKMMCRPCANHHRKDAQTRLHKHISVLEGARLRAEPETYEECEPHGKVRSQYCTTCTATFCPECKPNHEGHTFKTIDEVAEEHQNKMDQSVKEFSQQVRRLSECRDKISKRIPKLMGDVKLALIRQAKQRLIFMMNLIVKEEIETRKKIAKSIIYKAKELNLKRAVLDGVIEQLDQFAVVADSMRELSNPARFRSNYSFVDRQLKRLKDICKTWDQDASLNEWAECGRKFELLPNPNKEVDKIKKTIKKLLGIYYHQKQLEVPAPKIKKRAHSLIEPPPQRVLKVAEAKAEEAKKEQPCKKRVRFSNEAPRVAIFDKEEDEEDECAEAPPVWNPDSALIPTLAATDAKSPEVATSSNELEGKDKPSQLNQPTLTEKTEAHQRTELSTQPSAQEASKSPSSPGVVPPTGSPVRPTTLAVPNPVGTTTSNPIVTANESPDLTNDSAIALQPAESPPSVIGVVKSASLMEKSDEGNSNTCPPTVDAVAEIAKSKTAEIDSGPVKSPKVTEDLDKPSENLEFVRNIEKEKEQARRRNRRKRQTQRSRKRKLTSLNLANADVKSKEYKTNPEPEDAKLSLGEIGTSPESGGTHQSPKKKLDAAKVNAKVEEKGETKSTKGKITVDPVLTPGPVTSPRRDGLRSTAHRESITTRSGKRLSSASTTSTLEPPDPTKIERTATRSGVQNSKPQKQISSSTTAATSSAPHPAPAPAPESTPTPAALPELAPTPADSEEATPAPPSAPQPLATTTTRVLRRDSSHSSKSDVSSTTPSDVDEKDTKPVLRPLRSTTVQQKDGLKLKFSLAPAPEPDVKAEVKDEMKPEVKPEVTIEEITTTTDRSKKVVPPTQESVATSRPKRKSTMVSAAVASPPPKRPSKGKSGTSSNTKRSMETQTPPAPVVDDVKPVASIEQPVTPATPSRVSPDSSRNRRKSRSRRKEQKVFSAPGVSAGGFHGLHCLPPFLDDGQMKISDDPNDRNEDYCTVCRDGGNDVLICCDGCPKVFHTNCHLPVVTGIPEDNWQCNICKPKEQLLQEWSAIPNFDTSRCDEKLPVKFVNRKLDVYKIQSCSLTKAEFITACKFLCAIYQLENSKVLSVHFERFSAESKVLESPVHLNLIRMQLTLGSPTPINKIEELVELLRKMFEQGKLLYKEVEYYLTIVNELEVTFNELLPQYFPEFDPAKLTK